jgi:hypothetical protein
MNSENTKNIFNSPTVLFYKNKKREDSLLMNNVLLSLQEDYPFIHFYQVDTESLSDPIVLCYFDKIYRFCYSNPQLLRDLIDRFSI